MKKVGRAAARSHSRPQTRDLKVAGRAVSEQGVETRELPIEMIDWSLSVRNLQRLHIGRLAGAASLPAVVVWEFEKGRYRGVDGFHRWYLAKLRHQETIRAIVRPYEPGQTGEKQFDFDCIRLNIQHGLPLSREERNRAILRLWGRWGRNASRPQGVSLEELGTTFNLTRQRIQQIVLSTDTGTHAGTDRVKGAAAREPGNHVLTRSSGYSNLGRFMAAAKRLRTVLGDINLVQDLFHEHQVEVRERLQELRELLDNLLHETAGAANGSGFRHHERPPAEESPLRPLDPSSGVAEQPRQQSLSSPRVWPATS